ncbi:hypothetical protein Zmor_010730 [Zophobas morio]|uniref:3'-5' exonuclease domain-containing protein n=1 Tax=Zophobas morio TaxID=2755281 RepID=A0AA38IS90_9CUCU|nr:hypothetical protein Zmor_010730 [Zophobas morio]
MAPQLHPGDRVLIEIPGREIYEGTVQYVSPRSIELYDIFCQKTNTPYHGSMTFYHNEILSCSHIQSVPKPSEPTAVNGTTFDASKKIEMDPDEFHRLRQMTFNYVFVNTFGKSFDEAYEQLSDREAVAVVGLGNTFVRGKGLSLLLIADFKTVYIFDIFCLGKLGHLQDILESTFICKVLHNGSALYDCLYHKYKVEMQNVFDTKIVDNRISSEKNTNQNISECLTKHFNFPPSLLSAAIDDMTDKIWHERPVIKSSNIKAAQLVVYLLPLRDKLMSHIMKNFTDEITAEYVKYKKITDAELLKFKT